MASIRSRKWSRKIKKKDARIPGGRKVRNKFTGIVIHCNGWRNENSYLRQWENHNTACRNVITRRLKTTLC